MGIITGWTSGDSDPEAVNTKDKETGGRGAGGGGRGALLKEPLREGLVARTIRFGCLLPLALFLVSKAGGRSGRPPTLLPADRPRSFVLPRTAVGVLHLMY